ncbi:superoxide dismutase, Cu-Zn family [Cnuella takakiae]|uniref:Superoxide dismutase [Cu-Zn] n=1 Tax=Cnuella takakiae TaxID=1302690 RepID=A0A1M4T6A4_9BACT|nr:superoxide dismutase family protein [Cnuella takakiae]SHE39838.1 superoxide dismutase, Cu-Zn family [Cnuella takakiae]
MRISSFKTTLLGMILVPAGLLTACGNSEGNGGTGASDTAALSTTPMTTDTGTGMTGGNGAGGAQAVLSGTKADTTLSGTARFMEAGGRVTMNLDISVPKMANQTVAVHIHEHGDCGEMGNGAHGHWNPTKEPHGKWGEGQFHRGDIGNVTLDASGKGTLQLDTDLWSISNTDSTRNILNRAIIVHGGKDDFQTQPTGGAGSRIGCGVIAKM